MPGEGRLGEIFHYYNGKFDFHQRVYKVSDFSECMGKFIYYCMMNSFKSHALKNTSKATVDSIRLPTLTEFAFKIPINIKEQKLISDTLSNVDDFITLHQRLQKS